MGKINNAINSPQTEYTFSGIDMTAVGITPIFTTLATAGNFYVNSGKIILESVTGVVSLLAHITMGYNAPLYDNVDSGDFIQMLAPGEFILQSGLPTAINSPIPPSTTVSFNVDTAETTATSYVVKVIFYGNYI